MAFLALIIVFAVEQWRPFVDRSRVFAPLKSYALFLERQLNAGERQHGVLAWMLVVIPIVLTVWGLYALLYFFHPILGLVFNVAVLYVTMGFRQESHYFTDIHAALKSGDLDRARAILGEWQGHQYHMLTSAEVVRLTIEAALSTAHRHVFGVIFWFVILPGPTGAVLYRVALFLYQHWGERDSYSKSRSDIYVLDTAMGDETEYLPELRSVDSQFPNGEPAKNHFGEFTRTAFYWIDALPARFTAASFAIVGDFEDAIYCWRTQASRWPDPLLGIVMAAGAGALGVRLGMPIVRGGLLEDRPELGLGDEPDVAFLDSTVGLVWRALVLWMVFLLVLAIAMLVS